ncbi:MAG TPA: T9SS type A sorting domain-containing protein [Bacteroidia bacterium]|nr:T9SS type A sorting domain-containing protein [Bacteroidia bacterium]
MKLRHVIALVFVLTISKTYAQQSWTTPPLQWEQNYGGTANDRANDVIPTSDGGFIAVGNSMSDDVDLTNNCGLNDVWVVKTDGNGQVQWQRNYGGDDEDFGLSIAQTFDGGYIIGATTFSNNNNVSGNNGFSDFWVLKIDSVGVIEWSKVYGGSLLESLFQVKQLRDSSYVAVGSTDSNDGDVSGNHGESDYWVVRLNLAGDTIWTQCYGGLKTDVCRDISQLVNGNFVLAGYSNSNDGDLTSNNGGYDYWVLRIDHNFKNIIWQYNYGGSYDDRAYSLTLNSALGYLVIGSSYSNDINVSGHSGSVGPTGNADVWALKLTNLGIIDWENSLGGLADDFAFDAVQLADSSYTIAGYTSSLLANTSPNNGLTDYWLINVNRFGNRQWGMVYGGSKADFCFAIDTLSSFTYIIGGGSFSNDSVVGGNYGGSDYWLLRLDSAKNTTALPDVSADGNQLTIYPNPLRTQSTISIKTNHTDKQLLNIYNNIGQIIKSIDVTGVTSLDIHRNNFQAGVYHYTLGYENKILTRGKFVVE